MPGRLAGKTAIVTGGGSGIGRATALLFAREGAEVLVGTNTPADHPALERDAAELAGSLTTLEIDVSVEDDARRLVEAAVSAHGGLDILVNNAGIVSTADAAGETSERWQRILDVNLTGMFHCAKHAIPEFQKRGGGSIVNLSSINGIRGNYKLAAYCASKGGVVSLTHSMALDFAPENIRVNCICPGAIRDTRMVDTVASDAELRGETLEGLIAKHPLGRLGTPDEVAHAVLFLASDEAAFITGVTLPVDGGRSVR